MIDFFIHALLWFLLGCLSLGAALLLFGKRKKPWPAVRARSFNGLVGSYGITITDIVPDSLGKVEVHGTLWNAEAFEPIIKGTRVIIAAQDNLNLIVQKVE